VPDLESLVAADLRARFTSAGFTPNACSRSSWPVSVWSGLDIEMSATRPPG